MSAAACPDDLLVLSRRRSLTVDERGLVDRHLDGCDLCRMSAALGRALGVQGPPDAEDEALAARLVAAAMAPRLVPRSLGRSARARDGNVRWSSRSIAAAAAVILMAGTASGAFWRSWRLAESARRSHDASEPGVSQPRAHAPRAHAPRATGAPAAVVPSIEPVAPPTAAEPGKKWLVDPGAEGLADPPLVPRASERAPAAKPVRAAKPVPAAKPAPSASAAELFAAAGEARRARRLEDAIRLYRALQTDFPRTPEAEISRLSLGDLYLAHGSPAAALAQFDAYLAGEAAPELGEEALLGKARALDQLGRPADERAVWQGLLLRYPQSEYRWWARQRLAELARERP